MGALLGQWLPVGEPGYWAMIGMAAIMGGTMRSPLTGMCFVLELSHDLNALPALMVGSVAALGVTVLLMRRSILTEKLARRGQHIAREYSVDLLELMRVGDVMEHEIPAVTATTTVAELSNRIACGDPAVSRRQGTLILDEQDNLVGVITRGDVVRALRNDSSGATTVLDAGNRELIVAYPDEPLSDAIARMVKHDVGRLPVVNRQQPNQALGYLGRASILEARARHLEEEHVRGRGPISLGNLNYGTRTR